MLSDNTNINVDDIKDHIWFSDAKHDLDWDLLRENEFPNGGLTRSSHPALDPNLNHKIHPPCPHNKQVAIRNID